LELDYTHFYPSVIAVKHNKLYQTTLSPVPHLSSHINHAKKKKHALPSHNDEKASAEKNKKREKPSP
jgi:hypothetical protein